MGGVPFSLSKDIIRTDSPNFFTAAFLGKFQESDSKQIVVDRNPHIFELIVEYLRGYDILPLSQDACPAKMTPAQATSNLYKDAQFYGLAGLMEQLSFRPPRQKWPRVKYVWYHDLDGIYQLRPNVHIRHIEKNDLAWEDDCRLVLKEQKMARGAAPRVNSLDILMAQGPVVPVRVADAAYLTDDDEEDRQGASNRTMRPPDENIPARQNRPTPPVMLHADNVHVALELFPDDLILNYTITFLHPSDHLRFRAIREFSPEKIERRGTVEGTVAMTSIPVEVDGFPCCLADFMEYASVSAWSSKRDRTSMLDWELERVEGLSRIFGRPPDQYETFIDLVASELVFTVDKEDAFGGCIKLVRMKGKSLRRQVEELEFMRFDDAPVDSDSDVPERTVYVGHSDRQSDRPAASVISSRRESFLSDRRRPSIHEANATTDQDMDGVSEDDAAHQRPIPGRGRAQSVREVFQAQLAAHNSTANANVATAASAITIPPVEEVSDENPQPLSARRHQRNMSLET